MQKYALGVIKVAIDYKAVIELLRNAILNRHFVKILL